MCSDDVLALDESVQLGVAKSPFADPADLVRLAEDPGFAGALDLAEFGRLPSEAVQLLASHQAPDVRAMLVRNERLSGAAADLRTALLVDDPSSWVRSELLELDLPVALRRRVLSSIPEHEVLHPQPWMPEDLLSRIVAGAQDDEDLRGRAIWCLPADSVLLRSLCRAGDRSLRQDAAACPVLPLELRRRLVTDDDPVVRQFAVDRSLGAEVLLRLSDDPYDGVRRAVALDCLELAVAPGSTEQDVAAAARALLRAVHDADDWVRAAAALHVPLHAHVLDDPSEFVRDSVARTSQDPVVLARLADDPDPDVVTAVTGNPHAPPALLRRLCHWLLEEWTLSSGLADDEQPVEGLGVFRSMRESGQLASLVANPALPEDLAADLLVHRSPVVADAALVRLGGDPDAVAARALALRHRRGLLWQLLTQAGTPVQDPAVREMVLERLPSAGGTVGDLAAAVRRAG